MQLAFYIVYGIGVLGGLGIFAFLAVLGNGAKFAESVQWIAGCLLWPITVVYLVLKFVWMIIRR